MARAITRTSIFGTTSAQNLRLSHQKLKIKVILLLKFGRRSFPCHLLSALKMQQLPVMFNSEMGADGFSILCLFCLEIIAMFPFVGVF